MFSVFSIAHAQDAVAQTPSEPSLLASLFPIILIFAVFYFLVIRPQSKRLKEHDSMVQGLVKNDKVITSGGIIAKVVKVNTADETLDIEIAKDVVVKIKRQNVSEVMDGKQSRKPSNNDKKSIGKSKDKA